LQTGLPTDEEFASSRSVFGMRLFATLIWGRRGFLTRLLQSPQWQIYNLPIAGHRLQLSASGSESVQNFCARLYIVPRINSARTYVPSSRGQISHCWLYIKGSFVFHYLQFDRYEAPTRTYSHALELKCAVPALENIIELKFVRGTRLALCIQRF